MNLADFETNMPRKILARGQKYYKGGTIDCMVESNPGHFVFEVSGTADYIVDIRVDEHGEILSSNCTCPYDYGPNCKHEAAAFYALCDWKDSGRVLADEEAPKESEAVMKRKPAQESSIVITDMHVKAAKKLIKEFILTYKRRGFIEWRDVPAALAGVGMAIQNAWEIHRSHPEQAVDLSLAVLQAVIDMLAYCDDSNGEPAAAIYESLAIIQESVVEGIRILDDKEMNRMLKKLMKEAGHKRYDGYNEWRTSLLHACIPMCNSPKRRAQLEDLLNELLSELHSSTKRYDKEQLLLVASKLVQRFDGETAYVSFIKSHIDVSGFREMAIQYYMSKQQYEDVIQLCEEGKKRDKDQPGLVVQWEKDALEAYIKLGDLKGQKQVLKELLFRERDGYKYYSRLKKMYSHDEWQHKQKDILSRLHKENHSYTYLSILKKENLKEELLQYCSRNPKLIENTYPYLIDRFPEEVEELFFRHIEESAEKASNRKQYYMVCRHINRLREVCNDALAERVIDHLHAKYHMKPAFLDELSNVR
ncbi:SWIM zinc finger family protein [Bacillus sp. 1P06AnD]|uniref:SWIM zinc finger family protein n=1 Tax=Bacillus sp. 1P06AnD TaxID=3132208 RepID=UPI00399F7A10